MNRKALIIVTTLLVTLSTVRNEETVNDREDKQPLNDMEFGELNKQHAIRFWGPHNYPNPGKQKNECSLPNDIEEYVCDPDNIFTVDEIRNIAYVIEKVKDYPSMCLCGDNVFECEERSNSLHIGVAVLKHSAFNTTKVKFANHLRNTWNLGDCGNSLIVFIATKDKEMQILWGRRGGDLFLRKFRIAIEKELLHLLASDSVFTAVTTILEKIYDDLIRNHY